MNEWASWTESYQSELGSGKRLQNLINDAIRQEGRQTQLHLTDTQRKRSWRSGDGEDCDRRSPEDLIEPYFKCLQALLTLFNPQTHTDLILLMISTPDCSRRVLVTKLLGTTILEELAFISSWRRLLFFITWGQRASAASTIDSNRVWREWR